MDREEFPWLSRHFRALRTVSNVLVQHGGNVTLGQSSRSSYTNENYMQDSMLTMDFMTIVLASRDIIIQYYKISHNYRTSHLPDR